MELVPGHGVSDVHQLRPCDDVCLQEVTQRALLVERCYKPQLGLYVLTPFLYADVS